MAFQLQVGIASRVAVVIIYVPYENILYIPYQNITLLV